MLFVYSRKTSSRSTRACDRGVGTDNLRLDGSGWVTRYPLTSIPSHRPNVMSLSSKPPIRRGSGVTLTEWRVSHLLSGDGRRGRDGRKSVVTEYLQVWHARVPEGSVEKLLELRPKAIAEAKRLCPELLAANLVRLDDGTWLDVLRWSSSDGEERLMRHAERFDAIHKMHKLLEDAVQVGRGEILPEAG
jgi:hypothetical protein